MVPGMTFTVLWAVFFLHGMSPGLWLPALTNILGARGLGAWVPVVFMVPPLCALVSPLIGGALADQRMPADRLFAWSGILSSVSLALAFAVLDAGWHPWWFVGLIGLTSLLSGPSWGVLATVSLSHLTHGERQYPLVRVGATFGWIAGGLVTSLVLAADTSPLAGYAAALVRLVSGLAAFALPRTPPLGQAPTSLGARLGFGAFSLLKERDPCVFFVVTAVFSVPLMAFYMYGPEFLMALGDPRPTATMTVAQFVEVVCMFVIGFMMTRYRMKSVLALALGFSAIRYGLSAVSGVDGWIGWHIAGIALHGLCYTFYFITAQVFLDRRVDPGLRSQAQGLLAVVAGGIGPLAGAWFCGWLRKACVSDSGEGWDIFWGILAAIIVMCFAAFVALFQGRGRDGAKPSAEAASPSLGGGSDQLAGETDRGGHR